MNAKCLIVFSLDISVNAIKLHETISQVILQVTVNYLIYVFPIKIKPFKSNLLDREFGFTGEGLRKPTARD